MNIQKQREQARELYDLLIVKPILDPEEQYMLRAAATMLKINVQFEHKMLNDDTGWQPGPGPNATANDRLWKYLREDRRRRAQWKRRRNR